MRPITRSWLSKHILLGLGHFLPSCFHLPLSCSSLASSQHSPSPSPPNSSFRSPLPLRFFPDTCVPSFKEGGEFLISCFTAPSSLVTQSLGAELLASTGQPVSSQPTVYGQRDRLLSVLSREAGKGCASTREAGSIPKSKERHRTQARSRRRDL